MQQHMNKVYNLLKPASTFAHFKIYWKITTEMFKAISTASLTSYFVY